MKVIGMSSSMTAALAFFLVVMAGVLEGAAQGLTPLKFSKRLQVADGRTFVSDGAFAIDAAIAKVKDLPSLTAIPGGVLDKYIHAPFTSESSGAELRSKGANYTTPDGTLLNGRYVEYLREHTALRRLRFRMSGLRQPVILVLDGRAVGVLMPMAQ